jgi:uncharacterized membrane protein YcaP (DUF421 family)
MKPEEIDITDLGRIFAGEVPAVFFIEVILRALFVYVLLVVFLRLMGKRMAAQLDKIELAALVSLAAAVGVPLQDPERGLLPSLVIAIVVVSIGKIIFGIAFGHKKFERTSQDYTRILVSDATLDLSMMNKVKITRERLFEQLRGEGIGHLGVVDRVYAETSGLFTIIRKKNPQPGLSIVPEFDKSFESEILRKKPALMVCANCGKRRDRAATDNFNCGNCGSVSWVESVEDK